jgi:hypothetical protein
VPQDDWFEAWLEQLPLGERWWHSEFKRRDGKPPDIKTATAQEVRKLRERQRKHPDHVARRGVLTFDGFPIWGHAHLGKITWLKLTWEQDRLLE